MSKCNCIEKLAKLLDEADVPYERRPMWGGEQIRIRNLCDAVCHDFSYGNEDDLLEIMAAATTRGCDKEEATLIAELIHNFLSGKIDDTTANYIRKGIASGWKDISKLGV